MDVEPSTSAEVNNANETTTKWTRNLTGLPPFTYELLVNHLGSKDSGGTLSHKKLGYQMFKEKYVRHVQVKADINKGQTSCFLVKAFVNAAMKSNTYSVYVHLNESNGKVEYSNCTCPAGKGGKCKHIVALLFQIIEYKQLDVTEIPDEPTCTQLLQQWHVPRKDELDEPVLYEDITFQKKIYEKVGQSRKRKLNEPNLSYNPTPEFAQVVNKTEILRLANSLTDTNENSYLGKLLKSNDCTPCPFDIMHQDIPSKNKQVELLHFNINDTSVREQLLDNLARLQIAPNPHNATIENLKQTTKITPEQLVEIEQNTRDQSGSLVWFAERQNRITSSNFGVVIKRRKNIYPKSILSKIQCSKPAVSPKPCQWGKDKEELAVMEYLKLKRNAGCCVDVCSKCGFIVNREFPWLGASPDFLVFDPTEEAQIGVGEVKCPFSKRNLSLQEA